MREACRQARAWAVAFEPLIHAPLIVEAHVAGRHHSCESIWKEVEMLYTLAVILLIAWLLGLVGTYTIGAAVHLLLVVAIVLFLVGLLSEGRTMV